MLLYFPSVEFENESKCQVTSKIGLDPKPVAQMIYSTVDRHQRSSSEGIEQYQTRAANPSQY